MRLEALWNPGTLGLDVKIAFGLCYPSTANIPEQRGLSSCAAVYDQPSLHKSHCGTFNKGPMLKCCICFGDYIAIKCHILPHKTAHGALTSTKFTNS
jgi:hypothetical protein